jgi:SAM-dependent methyltransferase
MLASPRKIMDAFNKLFRKKSAAAQTENAYGTQLTESEIAAGAHRQFVGGMWDQIGQLQFEFLKSNGLLPRHRLADIGCGALRGGIHFVRYLGQSNYYGIDLNSSLIEAGRKELQAAGLADKAANLFVTDKFELPWDVQCDFALAVSVFTHLYANHIAICLKRVQQRLAPNGKFFATFFQAPDAVHLDAICHQPGGFITHYNCDPFHYSFAEMEALAKFAGLSATLIGNWNHPRHQQMLCFTNA